MAIPFPRTITTVDKFGVSIDQNQGQGPLLMPKVKYRWRVLFLGFGNASSTAEPLTLNTNSITIPTLSFETQQIHSYNSRSYYPGKHEWGTCSMVVRDTYDNTVASAVGAQLQRQLDHYNQTGWRSSADFKFKLIVQQLDGGHDRAVENIHMEACFLENAEWGDLDYSASDARTISLTIRPDNVIFETEGPGAEYTTFANPGNDPLSIFINR
jgi:hypothetical protein